MLPKEAYAQYISGKPLNEAFGEGIPLLTMEQVRHLNFMISRGLSYEQTVDSFLLAFYVNDNFRYLREQDEVVVLLNTEGALVKQGRLWYLYFDPVNTEHDTLAPDADLYEAFVSVIEKTKEGKYSCIQVPDRSLKTLVSRKAPFYILDQYCTNQPGSYLKVAFRIVREGPEFLFKNVPVCTYGKLTTVDQSEIQNYHSIHQLMKEYIKRCNSKEPGDTLKPFSIAVFGAPGAGKSFGVKEIAKSLGHISISAINLSQCASPAELFSAMDAALQTEAGSIPMIFFDEFDSELDGVSRGWLKYFLAPMQDGEFTIGGRLKKIPEAIFVFAGATASSFEEFLPQDKAAETEFKNIKGPDFVSRLKGFLDVKGPNPVKITDRSSLIRRALLLRTMLIQQAPSIYDPESGRIYISRSLLNTLLRVNEYKHGTRSIEFLLGMSRLSDVTIFNPSCLPMIDQMKIHVDIEDFMSKLTFELTMGRKVDQYSQLAHACHVIGQQSVAWEELPELYKKRYRNRIRRLGEFLLSDQAMVGLRPIKENATDRVDELYGPILEILASIQHDSWRKDKLAEGWTYGETDRELMLSSDMIPYEEVPEKIKELLRMDIRTLPEVLKQMGYELYRRSF